MIEKHYMLVTKNSCSCCLKALELLKEKDCSFAYTDMDNAQKLLDITMKQVDWETVPMIWDQTIEWVDDLPNLSLIHI